MQGVDIGGPVGAHVVPDQQHAAAGLDLIFQLREGGRAAAFRLVEIGHRGPAALTAIGAFKLPIFFALVKIVVMILELLSRLIALALQDFAVRLRQAHQVADRLVDAADVGIGRVDIAAIAGAISLAFGTLVQRRGLAVGVDHVDQQIAIGIADEILADIELHMRAFQPLDPGVCVQGFGHPPALFGYPSRAGIEFDLLFRKYPGHAAQPSR